MVRIKKKRKMSTIDYSQYKKLGLESGSIKDSQIKSSNDAFKSRAGHFARLNHEEDYWCSKMSATPKTPQWLETTFDEDTTVTGVMIQVSEVKKWLEHAIEGKRDFAEENNLVNFYITVSEKKKSLIGSAGWKNIGSFETNYKWDVHKGISYHKFDKPYKCRRIRLNCTKTLGGWCPALKHEWIG